jgi:hypothetical protein
MLIRSVLALLLVVGCLRQVQQVVAPEPEGGGTLTCAEIVEQCDARCSDPLCFHRCTGQGNPEGRDRHAALLDCGQRHGCTDEACMRSSCPGEIEACMGPQPAEAPEQAPDEAPDHAPAASEAPGA